MKPKISCETQKYRSRNPVKKALVQRFLNKVYGELTDPPPVSLLDLGCGEGYVLAYWRRLGLKSRLTGVDLDERALRRAQKRLPGARFIKADLTQLNLRQKYDTVLLMETLEHLKEPARALVTACRLGRRVIVSVPWEPWFSLFSLLSGRYLTRLGFHPDHRRFFTPRSFKKLIAATTGNYRLTHAWPWLIAIIEK